MTRAIAILLVIASTAAAQSKNYPKKPVDEDREREQHSDLWDAATHPTKGPYKEALDEARVKLDQRQVDARNAAIQILDHAIELAPQEPGAYAMRGRAYLEAQDWAHCADDLAAAVAHTKREAVLKPEIKESLGICQARAGRLSDAEKTLADAAAVSTRNGLVWMRLGETRIALGKLDEAKAALDTALDNAEGTGAAGILWLRALAYDRARQPSQAEEDIHRALNIDRTRSMIENPQYPLVGAGEHEYILALSYADSDPARDVELAQLYFRRFLKLAPTSPWKKRAEEHLRDLKTIELPLVVKRVTGSVSFDSDAAIKAVHAQMPQMRQCLAKLPGVVIEVKVTKVGPRTPDSAPDHPRIRPPSESVQQSPIADLDATKAETDDAGRCVAAIADKIAMPAVKDKDAWYTASFLVLGPQ